MNDDKKKGRVARRSGGYLHGYSSAERDRLRRQARILEPMVHSGLPFWRRKKLIEIGSGVGAQTELLLRYYPEIAITRVERSTSQIGEAKRRLARVARANGSVGFAQEDAAHLSFERDSFDGPSCAGSWSTSRTRPRSCPSPAACSSRTRRSSSTIS